ncbi:DUF1302 family protein [Pseudoduganella sp. UC29_106]|uniref:DUF1302 family protein n=1 Tax=Pseudoduganella sp. UC29_106 TaxID=3374553 RepID=UPI0037566D52
MSAGRASATPTRPLATDAPRSSAWRKRQRSRGAFTGNPNPDHCENKGFATSNAWGYRVQAESSYPNVFAGVNLKPRLFWSHDVKGYSADGTFVEDKQILSLALRAEYNTQYYVDFSYTGHKRSAKYDIFHDRDRYSVVAGINF